MFELIGLATLRVYGYGWLWGRRHRERNRLPEAAEAFGNGGHLMEVGMISMLAHGVVLAILIGALR